SWGVSGGTFGGRWVNRLALRGFLRRGFGMLRPSVAERTLRLLTRSAARATDKKSLGSRCSLRPRAVVRGACSIEHLAERLYGGVVSTSTRAPRFTNEGRSRWKARASVVGGWETRDS